MKYSPAQSPGRRLSAYPKSDRTRGGYVFRADIADPSTAIAAMPAFTPARRAARWKSGTVPAAERKANSDRIMITP